MIIYTKKLCTSVWLQTSEFFMQHKCKVVTQVQIINSMLLKLWISATRVQIALALCTLAIMLSLKNLLVLILTPNCIESYYLNRIPLKCYMYYKHCKDFTLWIVDNKWQYKLQGNFYWLFEAFNHKFSLNILLHLSPPKFVIMYFACFQKML